MYGMLHEFRRYIMNLTKARKKSMYRLHRKFSIHFVTLGSPCSEVRNGFCSEEEA